MGKKVLTAFFFVAVAGAFFLYFFQNKPSSKPALKATGRKIILITIDATRADRLGCYGYKKDTTPNIDKIAAKGVIFSNAIVQACFSGPSYATIITGLYPYNHGVRNHPEKLDSDNVTLAEILKENGFTTNAILAHGFLKAKWQYNQGFDEYSYVRNIRDIINNAKEWIENNKEKKIFLWLQIMNPHFSYNPPYPFNRMFGVIPKDYTLLQDVREKKVTTGRLMFDFESLGYGADVLKYTKSLYDGEIAYVDSQLASLFSLLHKLNIDDEVMIVITADHGESLGEHNLYFNHDFCLYDQVVKVPLIVYAPGIVPGGIVVNDQVRNMDIMPTILDLAGVKMNEKIDGTSLKPLINGKHMELDAFSENRPMSKERKGLKNYRMFLKGIKGKWRMLRTNRYKLIYISAEKGPFFEFYDLKNDPEEKNNIIDNPPEIISEMKDKLLAYVKASNISRRGKRIKINQKIKRELKSLGYLD